MSWDHRVVKVITDNEVQYGIHEVYYDGGGVIIGWTETPIAPFGESLDELRTELNRMMLAFDKEIVTDDE